MESQAIFVLSTKSLILRSLEDEELIDNSNDIKFFNVSPDSKIIAWSKSKTVELFLISRKIRTVLDISRSQFLGFSPDSTYFWVWNTPSDFNTANYDDNFKIFKIEICAEIELKMIFSSKIGSYNQCELFWLDNETAVQVGLKMIKYYKSGCLDSQFPIPGLIGFSCSKSHACLCIESNDSNLPSFAKFFKIDCLTSNPLASQPIKDKKDFLFYWNCKGNAVLISCLEKVDQVSSYYGNRKVFFLNFQGAAFQIENSENHSAHHISWFPKSDKFAIIHGGNPRTLTVYNNVGDPIKKVSTGNFNIFSINPFENLMCLSGIGDIKSHVEFWSLEKYQIISYMDTPTSNEITWMPDGQNLLFAATTPRIVVENGYHIFNYLSEKVADYVYPSETMSILQIQPILICDTGAISIPEIQIPNQLIDRRASVPSAYVIPQKKSNVFSTPNSSIPPTGKKKKKNASKT